MKFQNLDTKAILKKKLFIFDMDGTIYLGGKPFDFAIRFIKNLRAAGKKVLFFTNNASHTTPFYLQKLTHLGFEPGADEIMTSGDVTLEFLKRYRSGKSVYLVATDELVEEYREKGINLADLRKAGQRLPFGTGRRGVSFHPSRYELSHRNGLHPG